MNPGHRRLPAIFAFLLGAIAMRSQTPAYRLTVSGETATGRANQRPSRGVVLVVVSRCISHPKKHSAPGVQGPGLQRTASGYSRPHDGASASQTVYRELQSDAEYLKWITWEPSGGFEEFRSNWCRSRSRRDLQRGLEDTTRNRQNADWFPLTPVGLMSLDDLGCRKTELNPPACYSVQRWRLRRSPLNNSVDRSDF